MSEVHKVVVGEGGELFLPADVQAQTGLSEGTELMLLESPGGLILMTREQLLDRVRSDLAGLDLVASYSPIAEARLGSSTPDERGTRPLPLEWVTQASNGLFTLSIA